ncbi:hypothetical protein [Thiomicrorhabdus cannonii]|uniref:hypothetical protein n=1 Tax=Thiomicrorhabdus cannonii TaxID=2748011 RepID=UPI0015B8D49C|nr:hypothetical protein [Thiomicrorhabdus cannonii]
METLKIKHISQSPQAGGFYVLNLELEQAPTSLAYRYTLPEAALQATLFHAQQTQLQLLSQAALEPAFLENSALTTLSALTDTMPEKTLAETQQATLLLGADLGIGPLLYEARRLSQTHRAPLFALLHASEGFPFAVKPAKFMASGLPVQAIGACPLLEDWKIPNRLSSAWGLPGCYDGNLPELFARWLESEQQLRTTNKNPEPWRVRAFLPESLNQACAQLAHTYSWLQFEAIDVP